jgi:hypothetical protein
MRTHKLGLAAFAVPLLVTFLSFSAMAGDRQGQDQQGQDGWRSTSTPAPIAGIGLVSLGAGGAVLRWVIRRYRRREG